MDENKFAFIICVNNELYFEECKYWIKRLIRPNDYRVDIITIRDATSICAAYNWGMKNSDAKYKIYMHQDVFIRNKFFLKDLLRLFENPETGMVGMMGGTRMPKTGVAYLAWDVASVDCRDADVAYFLCGNPKIKQDMQVEAVDGLLIATQYDIHWREDLFNGFDFYDISASFEVRRAGYHIIVPYMQTPWVIHDSSFAKLSGYDKNRKICIDEYKEFLYDENGFEFEYQKEWEDLSSQLAEQLKQMLNNGKWELAQSIILEYRKGKKKNSTLEMIGIMTDIWKIEKQMAVPHMFFEEGLTWKEIYEKYIKVRFALRRIEIGLPESEYENIMKDFIHKRISVDALIVFVLHSTVDKKQVFKIFENIATKACMEKEFCRLQILQNTKGIEKIPIVYTQLVKRLERNLK